MRYRREPKKVLPGMGSQSISMESTTHTFLCLTILFGRFLPPEDLGDDRRVLGLSTDPEELSPKKLVVA